MSNPNQGSESVRKQDKHERLDGAIHGISNVTSKANYLLDRIRPQPQSEEKGIADVTTASLSSILDCGADRINSECEQICRVLEEIASTLFD